MTHLRRSVKYFCQLVIMFVVIIGALMALGYVQTDVNVAFRNGWTSILWIAGLFLVMAAVYPFFGYAERMVHAKGDPAGYLPGIEMAMNTRGYVPVSSEDGVYKYRLASPVNRAARMWEDTITITQVLGGFRVEGLVRDLSRVIMTIERNTSEHD